MCALHERAETLLSSLYAGPVRRVSERSGLHPFVFEVHQRIQTLTKRLDHRLAPNPYPVEVNDRTVRFDVSTLPEYNRVSSFLEEEAVIDAIVSEIRDDDVYWDVGANIGTHALLPAAAQPGARVIAVEPHHRNVAKLIRNKTLNELDSVTVLPIALGDNTGTATLRGADDRPGYGSFSLGNNSEQTVADVPVRPGDDVIADGVPEPTVVKIDVEGAECEVLDGLTETLSERSIRTVFCEVHRHEGVDESDVVGRLEDRGYDVSRITERGPTAFLKADRTESKGSISLL
ncbi:FkbM family methyltransferase [Halopiger aswanensis]|uniref:FkbM family methyltransferase n=1 Tax=Halopiger aswanensis TaxID=148449 RepID=A0A3R7I012_9EURY|nr:FkbM family methyltransferase [Halopiger aswanensis]RKD98069.1 FkbM family methyltransferase [Halopiger aswanensis]